MEEQISLFEDNPEYDAFVAKFKHKKTSDDCYTPPAVYDAVKKWACDRYHINPDSIVRPFYPGGDYERFSYPEMCTVLDNPPFSILQKICNFYLNKKIPFFLFAPSLTAFSGSCTMRINHIIVDAKIVYENGAVVNTAFVTSYGGNIVAQTAPDLREAIEKASKKGKSANTTCKELPRYTYPDHVVTAAILQNYARRGIAFEVSRDDCVSIGRLDEQKKFGKSIFGGGLLLSDEKAAERVSAETLVADKTATIKWTLSDREWTIVRNLSQRGVGNG